MSATASSHETHVHVHDKMQRDYIYELVVAPGGDFAEGFEPELSPAEMLQLGGGCSRRAVATNRDARGTGSR
jgi:hypothetical protein